MAGNFNRQTKKSFDLVSDIVFEGALLSDTRAILVTELIHYILYERQQIPLPVDQLKLRTSSTSQANGGCSVTQMNFPRHPSQNAVDRKARVFLDDLNQMCDNLKNSFRSCPEIDQVAILLGGTVVSPKESYVVKLPPPCPDADSLPLKSCKNTLFKQIIGEDILGSFKSPLSPSNVMVLLSAPRSCPLSWFLPKHTMSFRNGNIISFNFRCVYFVPICYDLSITECDISNISGLEPHECTMCVGVQEDQSANYKSCDSEIDNTKGEVCDSCTSDTCHSKSTGDQLPGALSILKDSEVSCSKVGSSKKLERFCEHKRLNYIFSSRKQRKSSLHGSSQDSPCTPDDAQNNISMDMCYTPGDKVYRDLVDSSSYERKLCDYIWYQSPVILKGFKDHFAHEH